MELEALKSIVESLLFVAEGPLTLQRLAEVIDGAEKKEHPGCAGASSSRAATSTGAACAWSKSPVASSFVRQKKTPTG